MFGSCRFGYLERTTWLYFLMARLMTDWSSVVKGRNGYGESVRRSPFQSFILLSLMVLCLNPVIAPVSVVTLM